MPGQNPDVADAVAQSLKDVIAAIRRPRAAALVRELGTERRKRINGDMWAVERVGKGNLRGELKRDVA